MVSSKAAVLTAAKEPLSLTDLEVPALQPNELLVKVNTIALNPVDWKVQEYGFYVQNWPHVLGSDVSGTVEAKGDGPQTARFSIGDRVFGFALSLAKGSAQHGAFQSHVVLSAETTSKSAALSDHEASILPMAVGTAGMGLWKALDIAQPPASGSFTAPASGDGILVWGASGSVGALTVQFAKASGFTVYATASPKHAGWIKDIGAKEVIDYKSADPISEILAAAKKDGVTIKYGFDAVAEGEGKDHTSAKTIEVVKQSAGKGKVLAILPVPDSVEKVPEIEVVGTMAAACGTDSIDLGKFIFNDWLEGALSSGVVKPVPKIEVVSGGLGGIQAGLDKLKAGVSGTKLVVPLN